MAAELNREVVDRRGVHSWSRRGERNKLVYFLSKPGDYSSAYPGTLRTMLDAPSILSVAMTTAHTRSISSRDHTLASSN